MTQETLDEMVKSPRRSRVWKTILAGALATGIGLLCLGCDTGRSYSLSDSRYSPKLEKKIAKLRYEFRERCQEEGASGEYRELVRKRIELAQRFGEEDYETWYCGTFYGPSFKVSHRAPPVTVLEKEQCAEFCEDVFGTQFSKMAKFDYQPTHVHCFCKDEQGEIIGEIFGKEELEHPIFKKD